MCEWCRLYCSYNICSACPDSLICFQFTFLPGDFYRSTLINHTVIYIKAAPRLGSRSHAMVTEVKLKTERIVTLYMCIYIYIYPVQKPTEAALMIMIYLSFIFECFLSWESNPQSWHNSIYQSTTHNPLFLLYCLTLCYPINTKNSPKLNKSDKK